MRPLGAEEVREAVGGEWIVRGEEVTLTGVTTDTRSAKAGELFVAIRGERFDGHQFLAQAAAGGCAAAIVAQGAPVPPEAAKAFKGGVIGVADTVAALGRLAAYHRVTCRAAVVAVTGSNGKTTVKRMIHHVLSRAGRRGTCGPKSFNNQIGVPLTLLGASAGDEYVVCEIGSNAPGEVAALAAIAGADVAVITSVGPTHLEKLGGIEGVAREKASLLGSLKRGGSAVVFGDSPELDAAMAPYACRKVRFGQGEGNDPRLTAYEAAPAGLRMEVNGEIRAELPLYGRHNALNALAAAGTAKTFGVSVGEALAALADFAGVEGRLERIECGAVTIIHDAYNANPASMLAAADVLAEAPAGRRVMVIGDMGELGEQSAVLHEQVGRRLAGRGIGLLATVGPKSRRLAEAARGGAARVESYETIEQAAAGLPALLGEGDVVLLKGSRAMAMERLIDPIRRAFSAPAGGQGMGKGAAR